MTTIDHDAIRRTLAGIELTHGVGTDEHHACSIAALNIALIDKLTDERHPCMSPVVRQWVVRVQDEMPLAMMSPEDEHGARWRDVLPLVAGSATAGPSDDQRVAAILGWLWDRLGDDSVLASVPTVARSAWDRMLSSRTEADAYADAEAYACHDILRRHNVHLADAAKSAADALGLSWDAPAYAAHAVARAGRSAAVAVAYYAANAHAHANDADAAQLAFNAAYEAAQLAYWRRADPAALLARLVGAA